MTYSRSKIFSLFRFPSRDRRMFLAAAVLMVILFVSILLFWNGTSMGSAEATTVKEKMYTSIEVQYGDTLWSLA